MGETNERAAGRAPALNGAQSRVCCSGSGALVEQPPSVCSVSVASVASDVSVVCGMSVGLNAGALALRKRLVNRAARRASAAAYARLLARARH